MGDSTLVKSGQPCPCGKSSDAYATYSDGHGHCFSCGSTQKDAEIGEVQTKPKTAVKFLTGSYVDVPKRGLNADTLKRYDYQVGADYHVANYKDSQGNVVAQKVRKTGKQFTIIGDAKAMGLFGQHLYRDSGKRVIVTEGEIDCLTVAQAVGPWPVVSLPNGAASARKALSSQLEWLLGFDEVVLWFDADEAGRKAVAECVDLFEPGKVKVVNISGYKDANEMAVAGKWKEIVDATWSAKAHRPDGLINGADLLDLVTNDLPTGMAYPWPSLTALTRGMLPGQLITFAAGTGLGKSTIVREIAYSLGMQDEKVAYIALEESVQRTALGFVGMFLGKPLHVPGITASVEDRRKGFDGTLGTGNFWLLDNFGSLDPELLLKRLRYLVKGQGCRYVVLDHLSILVSGLAMDDERKGIDHIMTSLRSFTEETRSTLILVSHLRRPQGDRGHEEGAQVHLGQMRGSHAIGQLSDVVIGVERDNQAKDNVSVLRVIKNRVTGETGLVTALRYNRDTGRMKEVAFAVEGDEVIFESHESSPI